MLNKFKGRALLADDMGLGKSISSLYAAIQLRRNKPIVVVCPNPVKWSWEDEVKTHTNLQSWVCEGRRPPKKIPPYVPPIIILNWEILQYWKSFLKKLKVFVIIVDELHYAKNPKAKRTVALRSLCRPIKFIFGLSGTPFENCPAELWVGLNIIRPDLYPSFPPFAKRFCKPRRTPWGIDYTGASNIPELKRRLRRELMVRRTRQQVLKDLPPVNQKVVRLDINRKEYDKAEKNILAWLISKGKSIRGMLAAPGMNRCGELLRLVAEEKQSAVIQWIDDFLATTDRKLVLFGHHHKFLKPLYEHYKAQAVLVDGTVKGRDRRAAIDAFCRLKAKRIFLGSITAAGTGINKLQTVCSDVAIGEFIWVPQKISQAIARIQRMGQRFKVNSYFLVAKDTIEYLLCRALIRKQNVFDAIMDGNKVTGDFDILKRVVSQLVKKQPQPKRRRAA